jgi:hypothetical protein
MLEEVHGAHHLDASSAWGRVISGNNTLDGKRIVDAAAGRLVEVPTSLSSKEAT